MLQVVHDVAEGIRQCAQRSIAQRDTTERNMGYNKDGRGFLLDFSAGKVIVLLTCLGYLGSHAFRGACICGSTVCKPKRVPTLAMHPGTCLSMLISLTGRVLLVRQHHSGCIRDVRVLVVSCSLRAAMIGALAWLQTRLRAKMSGTSLGR